MARYSQWLRLPRHNVLLTLAIVLAAVLWVVFVNSFNPHELLLGVVAVCGTVIFVFSVARTLGLEMQLRFRDVAQAWRLPGYILSGISEILLVLAKDLLHIAPAQNLYRVGGFESGKHDPVRVARTVLAVTYTTVAPNFIVIGIEPSTSRMLFQQISRTGIPPIAKSLGAKG